MQTDCLVFEGPRFSNASLTTASSFDVMEASKALKRSEVSNATGPAAFMLMTLREAKADMSKMCVVEHW
jgi:hypothetical protein